MKKRVLGVVLASVIATTVFTQPAQAHFVAEFVGIDGAKDVVYTIDEKLTPKAAEAFLKLGGDANVAPVKMDSSAYVGEYVASYVDFQGKNKKLACIAFNVEHAIDVGRIVCALDSKAAEAKADFIMRSHAEQKA